MAANVQAGAENRQAGIVTGGESRQTVTRPQARSISQSRDVGVTSERVERVVIRNDVPPWIWLLVLAGWLLDSPQTVISRALYRRRSARR